MDDGSGRAARDAHPRREHAVGIEAGINRHKVLHGADHEGSADEQQHGERHLGNHQRGAHDSRAAADAAARRLLQRVREARDAAVHRGRQAEQRADDERQGDRESSGAQVDVRVYEAGERDRGRAKQETESGSCEPDAERGGNAGEDAALGDELTQQPRPAGAHGGANRDFTLTRLRTCQQQICDIRARDEQHESHSDHQRAQGRTEPAEQFLVERRHFHAALLVRLGIRLLEAAGNRVHLRLRLRPRDSRLQPRENLEPPAATLRQTLSGVAHDERDPGVGAIAHTSESRRHDADDGVGSRVEYERLADDLGISAELPTPERVRQDNDGDLLRHHVFVRGEGAADGWRRAQQWKV